MTNSFLKIELDEYTSVILEAAIRSGISAEKAHMASLLAEQLNTLDCSTSTANDIKDIITESERLLEKLDSLEKAVMIGFDNLADDLMGVRDSK